MLGRWRESTARARVAEWVRTRPALDRAIVAVSPVHRARRAIVAAQSTTPPDPPLVTPPAVATPTWALNTLEPSPDGAEAVGWALLSDRGNDGLAFRVGGRTVESAVVGIDRPDAPAHGAPEGRAIGFRFPLGSAEIGAATWEEPLELAVTRHGVPLSELSYWYPGEAGVIPPASHRLRVAGNDDLAAFLIEGYTAFHTIDAALRRWSGSPITASGTVLDWGVGCGRFSRYLEPHVGSHARLVGVDVDEFNVNWCREHLPWGEFHVASGRPPMPLDDNSVDVVVGISVFTHIRPALEREWLAELARVVRPGGYLLLTTLGDANFARSGLGAAEHRMLLEAGTLDVGYNDGIDGAVADDPEYYRNVFHTERHVRTVWSTWFDVVAYEPASIGNHQDLWILRGR